MIGFFQNSMARHHRLIFGVLLVFIVVSFVFYTGSGSVADLLGVRRASVVMGVDVTSAEETAPYRLGAALGNGGLGRVSSRNVVERIFMVKTAESFQIPEPTQEQFSAFLSEQGLTSEVISAIRQNYDVSEEDLRTAIVHSWKIREFLRVFGNVPAVFDADVVLTLRELGTRWTAEFAELAPAAVTFSDRLPADKAEADKTLRAFYDAHKEDFRIAELVEVSFAKIAPPADAAAKIPEPTDFELSAFLAETLGNDAEKAAAELSSRRAEWVEKWKKSQALLGAAAEISNTLYEKLPTDVYGPRHADFAAVVEKSGLGFVKIPAFPRDSVPADAGVPAEILRSAADGLNETLWRTDAIPAGDAVYVLVFRGTQPSRVPAFEEVRDEVVSAWAAADREVQFAETATAKGEELKKALAGGENFSQAAARLGFSVSKPPAFTVQGVPAAFAGVDVVGVLKTVPVGELSSMFRVGEKAVFAKVVAKDVPATDEKSADFAEVRQMLDNRTSWQTLQMQLVSEFSELCRESGISFDAQE